MCNKYALAQILSIKQKEYHGPVFNIEIEDDNSYCVNGFAVHNCEAMTCGLPVIANDASVMPEHIGQFGDSARGWLVQNRLEIVPPDRFIKVVKLDALGEALWHAHECNINPAKKDALDRMQANCIEYSKGLTWDRMKKSLCDIIGKDPVKTTVPVDEII